MKCPECYNENDENAIFCEYCGYEIKKEEFQSIATKEKIKYLKEIANELVKWIEFKNYHNRSKNPKKHVLNVYLKESGIGKGLNIVEKRDVIEYTIELIIQSKVDLKE